MVYEAAATRRPGEGLVPRLGKIKVGDHVRISKVKGTFAKCYLPNWTEDIFTVSMFLKTSPPQVKVADYNGDEIEGSFYLQELQFVDKQIGRAHV